MPGVPYVISAHAGIPLQPKDWAMSDRVTVVTGATGSLGTALTERLAARGHRIAATYLIPDEAVQYEQRHPWDEDRLILRRVNTVETAEVEDFMAEVMEGFGRMDALACLVGGWAGGRDLADTDDLRWERMMDLNLRSAFVTLRAAIPRLAASGGGRILLVGSRAAVDTPPGQAAFNAAKAGVIALAQTAALELEDADITVNVIMPSVIDTPTTRAALPYADYVNWPSPEEIAAVADFVLAGESGVISGAAIPVYGRA